MISVQACRRTDVVYFGGMHYNSHYRFVRQMESKRVFATVILVL